MQHPVQGPFHRLRRHRFRPDLLHRLQQRPIQLIRHGPTVVAMQFIVHGYPPWTTSDSMACSFVRALCKAAATAPRLIRKWSAMSS